AEFVPIDAIAPPPAGSVDDLAKREFDLVGEVHCIDDDGGWSPQATTQLFRYHLHYMEWAWLLAEDPDRGRAVFDELWTSWRAGTTFGRWDAWSPYVVSLRAWVLCGVFDRLMTGSAVEDDVRAQLGLHAGFLRNNLELDVGGNHLIKNVKALLGLGAFLHDDELIGLARQHLEQQLPIQVLADGGHYERSSSYHCQVLGDLIDIAGLSAAAGVALVPGINDAIARMRTWLGTILMPDGDVPLFGDATLVGLDRIAALEPSAIPAERVVNLDASGYVVCRPGPRLHVVCDVGPPCPPDLPAHAQAGCLAFVAAVDGERAIVDTGVSTYVGDRRAYERSTAAHNTVEVGEIDQTEVWGSFRAGRLAAPVVQEIVDDEMIVVEASHDGYRHLDGAPVHTRRFEIEAGRIVLRDSVLGTGFHRLFSRVFLAPGIEAELTDDGVGDDVTAAPFELLRTTVDGESVPAWVVWASVASSFGSRTACHSVWWEIWEDLPREFVTEIVLAASGEGD
ncbi:MAG: heparinase II/III domain-containing protein, partial [Acidimicrobiales bacterium]